MLTKERFLSRGQQLCKFMRTKEIVYIRKEPRSTHYSGYGIVTTPNVTTTQRLRRKQTARSNDRKRVSVHDNTVFNDLAHVQGSVHVIVVWSRCFRETNKVIPIDPFRHTKFYTTHQTVLTSRQWRYLCMPKPSNSVNAWRTSRSYQHIQSLTSYYAKLRQIKLICGHV